ncbi:MAG: hypothetical protein IT435_15615 [Phycisphaerales bacterium]|nr:hypothetical protein [Phycisphaerales bacterium]
MVKTLLDERPDREDNQGLVILCCPADVVGTGFTDTDDFDAYVLQFELGC